jgi:hypothetical protein
MRGQKRLTLPERAGALLHKHRIFAHLGDCHSGTPQAIHQAEPADMEFRVNAAPAGVALDAGNQPL